MGGSEPVSAGWPQGWLVALGDASLRDASSPAIFQRGKAYATSGSVAVVAEDPLLGPALRAKVNGTEIYTTEVKREPVDLKRLVNDVLSPGRGFIAWNEAGSYARRAEAVVPLLRQACERDSAAAVGLCVHALRRAWGVLAPADDSDGEIGGVCEAIGTELMHAVRSAGPQQSSSLPRLPAATYRKGIGRISPLSSTSSRRFRSP